MRNRLLACLAKAPMHLSTFEYFRQILPFFTKHLFFDPVRDPLYISQVMYHRTSSSLESHPKEIQTCRRPNPGQAGEV